MTMLLMMKMVRKKQATTVTAKTTGMERALIEKLAS
jgi:hypothetical protein